MRFEVDVVRARAPHALARALAATFVVVAGAAAAHTWAGGALPTGPGLVVVSTVVLAGSLACFARDVPAWAMLPAVALAQLGMHESFGLVPAHAHHAATATEPGWTWQMVLAHAGVTVATALLWWAGRRAASYAVSLTGHPALPVVGRLRRTRPVVLVRHSLVHLLTSPRRGPPLAVTHT